MAIDVVVVNGVFQKQKHLLDICIMVGKVFDTKSSMHTKILVKVLPLLVDELLKSGTGVWMCLSIGLSLSLSLSCTNARRSW